MVLGGFRSVLVLVLTVEVAPIIFLAFACVLHGLEYLKNCIAA